MTFPPEFTRAAVPPPPNPQHPVPQATAILAPVPTEDATQVVHPTGSSFPPPPASSGSALAQPVGGAVPAPRPLSPVTPMAPLPAAVSDPRIAAFGAGRVDPDPPVLSTLLRWGLPVVTAGLGLLVGVAVTSGGDRPTAPVPISDTGVTTSVTATATATRMVTATVSDRGSATTHKVTTTAVRVTTAPPVTAAPVTVTETATVTVTQNRPRDRRQPIFP